MESVPFNRVPFPQAKKLISGMKKGKMGMGRKKKGKMGMGRKKMSKMGLGRKKMSKMGMGRKKMNKVGRGVRTPCGVVLRRSLYNMRSCSVVVYYMRPLYNMLVADLCTTSLSNEIPEYPVTNRVTEVC